MGEQNRDKSMQAKPDHQSVLKDKEEFLNPEHKARPEATHRVQDMAQASRGEGKDEKRRSDR